MNIHHEIQNGLLIVRPEGRLDAFGSEELGRVLNERITPEIRQVLIDLPAVNYLSSAGLRVFLSAHKKMTERNGLLMLSGLQDYCKRVLDISGFSDSLSVFPSRDQALAHARAAARPAPAEYDEMEVGRVRVLNRRQAHGTVDVMGHINDVLYARVTIDHIANKPFFQTEYSLGLGALGDKPEDYLPIMGEAIMIGGTMVWLPTDGNDTADFLIPKKHSASVVLRTGFNVSVRGGFGETLLFESRDPDGATMSDLYRSLFDWYKRTRADFRGALGLAMRAEVGRAYGSGVTKSPVLPFKPANGEMIIDPSNFAEWFEIDQEPRHTNLTALICGAGVDLDSDLSQYNREHLDRAFYINPSNKPARNVLLHNHAVFFSPQPLSDQPDNLEDEIQRVVDNGDFVDMRHLLDQTTVKRAIIGVNFVQEFREDTKK